MKRGDRRKLAEMCEAQGGTVRRTKSGWMAKHPNGGTVGWHASPSSDSRRADKNLIADLRRAGFTPAISF